MTRPHLKLGRHLLPGLVAVALFGVLAGMFLNAPLGTQAGFPAGESVTANIGYAMFDLTGLQTIDAEGFLIAFEIIDVLLVAALVAAVMLARRESPGEGVKTALGGEEDEAATDGGRDRDRGGDS